MESLHINPEFRINPENFNPCLLSGLVNQNINQRIYYELPNSAF